MNFRYLKSKLDERFCKFWNTHSLIFICLRPSTLLIPLNIEFNLFVLFKMFKVIWRKEFTSNLHNKLSINVLRTVIVYELETDFFFLKFANNFQMFGVVCTNHDVLSLSWLTLSMIWYVWKWRNIFNIYAKTKKKTLRQTHIYFQMLLNEHFNALMWKATASSRMCYLLNDKQRRHLTLYQNRFFGQTYNTSKSDTCE